MNYYTGTIQAEAKKWAAENPETSKDTKDTKEDK